MGDFLTQVLVALIGGVASVLGVLFAKDVMDGVILEKRQEKKNKSLMKDIKRIIAAEVRKKQAYVSSLKEKGEFDNIIDGDRILGEVIDSSISAFTCEMVNLLNDTYTDPKVWMAGYIEDLLLEFKGKKL